MTTTCFLSWAVFLSTVLLLGLKLWHWWDTTEDWRNTKFRKKAGKPVTDAVLRYTEGELLIAWAILVDGVFWFGLGLITLINRFQPTNLTMISPLWGRTVLLIMVLMECLKLLLERRKRVMVNRAI